MGKVPVYFMPGMAANTLIFEKIKLPSESFDLFFLEWLIPLDKETLQQYAKRMVNHIKQDDIVLIGVSFGGILVQEMSKILKPKKVIIISSVKSNQEFPWNIKLARKTKIYKLILNSIIPVEELLKLIFRKKIKKHLKLYQRYLSVTDPKYLNWSIEQIITWDQEIFDQKTIHIQGNRDEIFPVKNITNYISVEKGTHTMIVNKYKWFNENLPDIILGD